MSTSTVVQPTSTTLAAGSVGISQGPAEPDGVNAGWRLDKFGAALPWMVAPTRHQFAEEGSYIVSASNRFFAPGVGIPWQAQSAFNAATPALVIVNTAPAPSSPGLPSVSLYLDYLKLIATAAATGATSIQYAVFGDGLPVTVGNVNWLPLDVQCPNAGLPAMSTVVALFTQQAVTTTVKPSTTAKLVARGVLGGLNIAGTEMLLAFGSTDVGCFAGTVDSQPGRRGSSAPPIIIPPQSSASIHIWAPGSTASFAAEIELGMWAR